MIPLKVITRRQGLHPKLKITTAMENAVVTKRPMTGLQHLLSSTDSSRYTGVSANPAIREAVIYPLQCKP